MTSLPEINNYLESLLTNKYYITNVKCKNCSDTVTRYLKERIPSIINIEYIQGSKTLNFEIPDNYIPDHIQNILDEIGSYPLVQYSIITTPTLCNTLLDSLNTFYPLILILCYITVPNILYYYTNNIHILRAMDIWMGLLYLVFSFFKLLNINGFITSFTKYDIFTRVIPIYAYLYPFIEIGLSYLYLSNRYIDIANIITVSVFSENIISVLYSIYNKQKLHCACLGSVLNVPLSTVTIIEDLLMISMGIIGLLS